MDLNSTFVRKLDITDNKTLAIHQTYVGDVGVVVWDAALVLAKYLLKTFSGDKAGTAFRNSKVIELGSGTGIVGLTAACLGAEVVITDLEALIPLMEKNITCNSNVVPSGTIRSCKLMWGDDVSGFDSPDYILVSDCIYYEESLGPLVKTLCDLSHKNTKTMLAYEKRCSEEKLKLEAKFFELLQDHFSWTRVKDDELDPEYCSPDIHILILKTKSCQEQ